MIRIIRYEIVYPWQDCQDPHRSHPEISGRRAIPAYDLPPVEKSGGAGTVSANGATFPLAFSRPAVEEVTEHRLVLRPTER